MRIKTFNLKKSYWFYPLINLIYGGAFVCGWLANLSWQLMIIITIIGIANLRHVIKKSLQFNRILWLETKDWFLYDQKNQCYAVKLLSSSFCSRWLIILNFLQAHDRHTLLILADMIDKNDFRHLQQCLL